MLEEDHTIWLPSVDTASEVLPVLEVRPRQRPAVRDARPASRPRLSFGYRPRYERLHRAWNLALVCPMILALVPLFAAIALMLALTQESIIYRGPRLGRHKRIFHIYKFCTLAPQASHLTRASVLPARSRLETRFGKYLRQTRLDELPQLLNILNGDMHFVGPRPVRLELAVALGHRISNYDARFEVRPGLVGYTQSAMTHAAPKALRSRMNVHLCRRPTAPLREMLFLLRVGLAVLMSAVRVGTMRTRSWLCGVGRERRAEFRMRPHEVSVYLETPRGCKPVGTLVDINDEAFTFVAWRPVPTGCQPLVLKRSGANRRRGRATRFEGHLERLVAREQAARPHQGYLYKVRYLARSDFNQYLIDRYYRHKCVLSDA